MNDLDVLFLVPRHLLEFSIVNKNKPFVSLKDFISVIPSLGSVSVGLIACLGMYLSVHNYQLTGNIAIPLRLYWCNHGDAESNAMAVHKCHSVCFIQGIHSVVYYTVQC